MANATLSPQKNTLAVPIVPELENDLGPEGWCDWTEPCDLRQTWRNWV